MKQYQNILIAVDIFENYCAILDQSKHLSDKFGAKLHLVYVLPHVITSVPYAYDIEGKIQEDSKKQLEKVQQESGIDASHIHLCHGNPKDEITRLAKKINADLILVGSHGKHGIDLILGSTANGVLHTAECDVLTIRVDKENQHLVKADYSNILVATDLEKDNKIVIETAKVIADKYHATLHLLNVVPNTTATAIAYYPNIEMELRDEAEKQIKAVAKKLGVKPENTQAVVGLPRNMIVDTATQTQSELIVIGSHGHHALASALLGSTANAVLHAAKHDTLVVRIK